ncbi:hypothetical protein A0H81_12300 [Grifola frondosa]|uniref:Uncharacterized protein n=1 Tax=Grifola frondosa TaxID=5627 RepID=A0A1C7LTA7_GRIFR|nr:hypothetical protein A0H81_12300 [Grifola frondosa]
MSVAASLGVSLLWDTDVGLSQVDNFTYSSEEHIKAGTLLATGILNTCIRTEADARQMPHLRCLAIAYVSSHGEDILPLLVEHIADDAASMEIESLSALALGFMLVGSGNGIIASMTLERGEKELDEKWARLALLYLDMGL